MLKYRLISGPILIALFLGLIWLEEYLGNVLPFRGGVLLAITLITAPLTARELCAIVRKKEVRASVWFMTAAVGAGLIAMFISPILVGAFNQDPAIALAPVPSAAVSVFGASLVVFCHGQTTQGVVQAAAANLLAFVYLGVALGFYFLIRDEHSAWWIVGIIMTTKMCDSGAYFTGRAIGKHKLIPWLSPGKTWEGLLGGLIAASIAGAGFAAASTLLPEAGDHVTWWVGAVAGGVFGVFGQLGDLAMSAAKRDAGVKDASTILPGLGGMLDVLDSPLLVAPVAYWFFLII